jgi:hypothetical protein
MLHQTTDYLEKAFTKDACGDTKSVNVDYEPLPPQSKYLKLSTANLNKIAPVPRCLLKVNLTIQGY